MELDVTRTARRAARPPPLRPRAGRTSSRRSRTRPPPPPAEDSPEYWLTHHDLGVGRTRDGARAQLPRRARRVGAARGPHLRVDVDFGAVYGPRLGAPRRRRAVARHARRRLAGARARARQRVTASRVARRLPRRHPRPRRRPDLGCAHGPPPFAAADRDRRRGAARSSSRSSSTSAGADRLPQAPRCPILPASNPFNQRVDRLPVAAELRDARRLDRRSTRPRRPTSARAPTTAGRSGSRTRSCGARRSASR